MADQSTLIPVMFLASDQWSPRFENTFFTLKLESFESLNGPPGDAHSSTISKGKGTFPAYYYKIDVHCGHSKHSVLRRYSQFTWLVSQIPPGDRPDAAEMPPGTWICQQQNNAFAQNRMQQLRGFLEIILQRPEVASHPSVAAFLELDIFAS